MAQWLSLQHRASSLDILDLDHLGIQHLYNNCAIGFLVEIPETRNTLSKAQKKSITTIYQDLQKDQEEFSELRFIDSYYNAQILTAKTLGIETQAHIYQKPIAGMKKLADQAHADSLDTSVIEQWVGWNETP